MDTPAAKKVYRYMSRQEFEKMMAGEELVNTRGHHVRHATGSVGFCFLGEHTVLEYPDGRRRGITPEQAYAMLAGIVDGYVLVEFETEAALVSSYARYEDPFEFTVNIFEPLKTVYISELSVTEYSRETFRPVRYCVGHPQGFRMFYGGEWTAVPAGST